MHSFMQNFISLWYIKRVLSISSRQRPSPTGCSFYRTCPRTLRTTLVYGYKLVNMIQTKQLCASWWNLADMFTIMRGWTLLILEVTGQRWRSWWASLTNVGCAGMLRFALLYFSILLLAYSCPRILLESRTAFILKHIKHPLSGSVIKADYVFPYIYMYKCPPPFLDLNKYIENLLKFLKHLNRLYTHSSTYRNYTK